DDTHRWLQLFSADDSATARRSLAVEPMTSPPDAFRSGIDLVHLAPAGEAGDTFRTSWGITALADASPADA
ncbi:MAG: aldose 1-epimerase family protein, partial [Nocardioides sp.]